MGSSSFTLPCAADLPSGWSIVSFAEVAVIANGQVLPTEAPYIDYFYVGPENIEGGTGRIINLRTIRELGLTSGKYLFDANSIIYSKIRPHLNKVCVPNFEGLCSADAYPIKPKEALITREYLFNYMKTPYFLEQSIAVSMRTGMPKINRQDLNTIKIILPPLAEQKPIANLLDCWLIATEQIERLIAAKAESKRGLRAQLLTGKRRFQEFAGQEWQRMRVSDFTTLKARTKTKPDKLFTALGIRSHGKGTFLKPAFDPARIAMAELFEVKESDLIVNITFAWEGAIAVAGSSDDGALVSHRFPTYEFKTDLAIPEFFRYVILQKWFVDRLRLISPGGAGRNRVLSKKDFGKLEVLMPSVEEQRRIASVLNACDKEIEMLRKQLDALKRQKRGLTQRLLTGHVRLNARDGVQEELVTI